MTVKRTDMRSLILMLLLFAGAQSAALPEHTARPGGIAVIAVGQGEVRPTVVFAGRKALLNRERETWYANIGIPLSQPAGSA